MTKERVHDIMENELRCVQRAGTNRCDRKCEDCDLLMDTDEIVEAYGMVIKMLEKGEIEETGHWEWDPNGMDWNLGAWVCSKCHAKSEAIPSKIYTVDGYISGEKISPYVWTGSQYCAVCGVKMQKGES